MDVVICVSSKDCLIVKKTVFYIHFFLHGGGSVRPIAGKNG